MAPVLGDFGNAHGNLGDYAKARDVLERDARDHGAASPTTSNVARR